MSDTASWFASGSLGGVVSGLATFAPEEIPPQELDGLVSI